MMRTRPCERGEAIETEHSFLFLEIAFSKSTWNFASGIRDNEADLEALVFWQDLLETFVFGEIDLETKHLEECGSFLTPRRARAFPQE
ncbi:MAG: hypothetical protein ACJAVK_000012 [Akkermansiaceae bacterium]|jgi:hypothetical protein